MGKKDPRVDAFIDKSGGFSQPVLRKIRQIVHTGCPEVEETIKWGMPSFTYKGILCGMAAFKQHCTFGFWHPGMKKQLKDWAAGGEAMGQLGRMTCIEDLPPDVVFVRLVREAVQLQDSGIKPSAMKKKAKPKPPPKVPADLKAALVKNKKASAGFDSMSPSHKREYVEWITQAKRPETRVKRIKTAIQWLAQGKGLNWKYEKC